MPDQICPKCHTHNRVDARFCKGCGNVLKPAAAAPQQSKVPAPEQGASKLEELLNRTRDVVDMATKKLGDFFDESEFVVTPVAPAKPAAAPPTVLRTRGVIALPRGQQLSDYLILSSLSLQRSAYYQVRALSCSQHHPNPQLNLVRCAQCREELPVFLIHHTQVSDTRKSEERTQLVNHIYQAGPHGILRHRQVQSQGSDRYVILDYPGDPWKALPQTELPVTDPTQLASWVRNVGESLQDLANIGFWVDTPHPIDLLEALLLVQDRRVWIADLVTLAVAPALSKADQVKQVACLSQLLYTLASGKYQKVDSAPRDFSDVQPAFRRVLEVASQGGYKDLSAYLEAVRRAGIPSRSQRSLRQSAGHRTDVGKVRDHNEDFVGKHLLGLQQLPQDPELGLYLVADGMGGHQAGELASKEVVRVVLQEVQDKQHQLKSVPKVQRSTIKLDEVVSPGDVLRKAILQANQVLVSTRKAVSSDRGTTITAALIVGNMCAIANVGDSRTYIMRGGKLEQVTQDHSLVAKLLAANLIKPEEVRTHPNRNQIYRTLGDKPQVDVDIFSRTLQAGDRLLLCSDGLWEMVLDKDIEKIMRQASTPTDACDQLVAQANLVGGEDNISAVVVWIE